MTNLGHVLDESFVGKLQYSKTLELDPKNSGHKEWAKCWRQNTTVVAAIVGAQESEDVILGLQGSNTVTITFPSEIASTNWKELKNVFQSDDSFYEMSMEDDTSI